MKGMSLPRFNEYHSLQFLLGAPRRLVLEEWVRCR